MYDFENKKEFLGKLNEFFFFFFVFGKGDQRITVCDYFILEKGFILERTTCPKSTGFKLQTNLIFQACHSRTFLGNQVRSDTVG